MILVWLIVWLLHNTPNLTPFNAWDVWLIVAIILV